MWKLYQFCSQRKSTCMACLRCRPATISRDKGHVRTGRRASKSGHAAQETTTMCLRWCGQSRLGHGPRRCLPAFPNLVGHVIDQATRDAASTWFGPSHYRLLISLVSERQPSAYPRSARQRPSQLADARWIHWEFGTISPIWFPWCFFISIEQQVDEIIHLILNGYFFYRYWGPS